MSEGLEKLRTIGTQKIYEETHIAKKHVQAVIDEIFDGINRIHFLGFISILEREYGVDLSEVKLKADEFYGSDINKIKNDSEVFFSADKKNNHTVLYIAIVISIFVIAVLFSINSSSDSSTKVKVNYIDNSAIDSAKETIIDSASRNSTIEDKNISTESVLLEANKTDLNTSAVEAIEEELAELVKSFKIIPSARLWLGYIDRTTYKKYQKTTRDEIILDPTKEWLLIFGHNNVRVEIDGKRVEFQGKQNIRLLYRDSKLIKITTTEFKKLNRGKKW